MSGTISDRVLNRANGRRPLFDDDGNYTEFECIAKWFLTPFRVPTAENLFGIIKGFQAHERVQLHVKSQRSAA